MSLDQVSVLHLRYFLAVVERGSVAGAARELGIAQPSLSQQIRLLESRLGARLFTRSPAGMSVTDAGERLAGAARSWLTALDGVAGDPAPLRVGVPRGTGPTVLDLLRARLGPAGDDAVLTPCDSASAPAALRRGELDAALTHGPLSVTDGGLAVEPITEQPLGLLAADATLEALPRQGDAVDLSALSGLRLVWFDESRAPEHARWLRSRVREAGWDPELVRIDPAGEAMTQDVLRRSAGLVALRPAPEYPIAGLAWTPVTPSISEQILLIRPRAPRRRH